MARKNDWTDFYRKKNELLAELSTRTVTIKFESYEETDKAWIITKDKNNYTFPKSKTILFKETNTIDVPNWLYASNFKENDNKKF